jgi:hypothetical protein
MGATVTETGLDALLAAFTPFAARCKALDAALWQRATDIAAAAGIPGGMRNMWHNALVARDVGKPWAGVNYSLLRRAMRLDNVHRARVTRMQDARWKALWNRHMPDCAQYA